MLLLFWFLLAVVAVCIGLLIPVPWSKQTDKTSPDLRSMNSPETDSTVAVRFRALRAALTGKQKE
jgi:hypothetical protein